MKIKRAFSVIIGLLLVLSVFVSCEFAYSSQLDATKKWVDKYVSVMYDEIKKYEGKTIAEANEMADEVSDSIDQKKEKYADEKYPYDSNKTMRDVVIEYSDYKDNVLYYYVAVPIPEDDKDVAETMAEEKGDQYYVIGLITVKMDKAIEGHTEDELTIDKVTKKVYVSAKLPDEE